MVGLGEDGGKRRLIDSVLRTATTELRILWFAAAWWARPDRPQGAQAFSYHRNMQVLLWMLLAVSALEIGVTLVALRLMSPRIGGIVSALSAIGVVYLLGLINAFAKLPLLVTPRGVRVRAGLLVDQWVGFEEMAEVRLVQDCGDPKRPGFLKASALAYPNTLIELVRPRTVRTLFRAKPDILTIGLHPDDAPAFVDAVRAAKAG